ncbi:hypothetical protein MVES_000904 [Malassezia vespertilionis]|uniref:Uncharacterized protein n=1 Tax=Malassezia vespertilionis TaxID=2020962 RepID=A0A2N1JFI6_9BASI|nr:hypothetical protein MVES_000904 [Malassezia vespertilionis]
MPKTPKRFAEEGGLSHLLALSQQAVEKKDAQFQKRIERREVVRNSQEKARKERVQRKDYDDECAA